MAFNDLCDHNVRCGQERQTETTMESHEVLFLLLAPTIALVVPLILLLSVVTLLRRRTARNESTVKEGLHQRFYSKQDSTEVDHKRTRRKKGKKNTRTRRATDCSTPRELYTVGSAVTSLRTIATAKGLRTVVVEKKMPSFPCQGCRERTAKKGCTYKFCASCCRNCTDSVCAAHGTGFVAAQERVYQACKDRVYVLDLSFSHLSRYPDHIPDVGAQLEHLNMSTNRLTNVPEDIGSLSGVTECYLQYNCLTKLPDSMCHMIQLRELDLKNNRLSVLPDDIGKLKLLRVFTLSNNNLKSLPRSFGELLSLEELNLHQNELESLPDELCNLVNLESLYLGKNKLSTLPKRFGDLTSLVELDLSECRLTTLPDSICRCLVLDKLWINNNQLMQLPAQIGDLRNLREFHVRSNQLRCLPATVLNMRPYTFTGQDNNFIREMDRHRVAQFTYCPDVVVPSLQELVCRFITNSSHLKWRRGVLPEHLTKFLDESKWCTRCGGPYFEHVWTKLVFGVLVVSRVPILHEVCSLYCKEDESEEDNEPTTYAA